MSLHPNGKEQTSWEGLQIKGQDREQPPGRLIRRQQRPEHRWRDWPQQGEAAFLLESEGRKTGWEEERGY